MPKGRPSKNGKELQFKTVAVPEETYKMISELAELEERSIARQLGVVIKNAHQTHFNTNESLNRNWILGLLPRCSQSGACFIIEQAPQLYWGNLGVLFIKIKKLYNIKSYVWKKSWKWIQKVNQHS